MRKHLTKSRVILGLKALLLIACVGILVRTLAHADWATAGHRLEHVGLAVLLIPLPLPIALLIDAAAWSALLGRLERRVPLLRLFRVRLSTEAVTNALPAGAVAAEVLGPVLLARDVPVAASLSTSAAKRWIIIRTHGYYVAIAGVLGFQGLAAGSRVMLHNHALPWIVFGFAFALLALSLTLEKATTRFGIAGRVHDSFERVKHSRLFSWARVGARESFAQVDTELARLGKQVHVVPNILIFTVWMLEALESYVILRVLGVHPSFIDVFALDAALSVVRSLAVFAPAGLGVQDLGYLAFFQAYGFTDPMAVGPAFLILKRTKDLIYVAVGLVLLLIARRTRPQTDASETSADADLESAA